MRARARELRAEADRTDIKRTDIKGMREAKLRACRPLRASGHGSSDCLTSARLPRGRNARGQLPDELVLSITERDELPLKLGEARRDLLRRLPGETRIEKLVLSPLLS